MSNKNTTTAAAKQGDERYLAEWCSDIPTDENGDGDLDNAKHERRAFPTYGQAVAFARGLLARKADAFGSVPIARQRLVVDMDIFASERRRVLAWRLWCGRLCP